MSGGYEYNLTTQSQFEDMKQRNQDLMEENYKLKKTIEELIKVNNELSETLEQFNNSEWAASLRSKMVEKAYSSNGNISFNNNNHDQCEKVIQGLEQQIQCFKSIVSERLENQENADVISTLEGLIQSFKQAQKIYQTQIAQLCEEIDSLKSQWQNRIKQTEQMYQEKGKSLDQIIRQLKRKQEIVSQIEKKSLDEPRSGRKIMKKNSEIDTSSERKVASNVASRQIEHKEHKQRVQVSSKQIEELKRKQKKLNQQLKEKDNTISIYNQLINKLKKKLAEKY